MTNFIEDIKKMGDQTIILNGSVYMLKSGEEGATFHIMPQEGEIPEPIDLSFQELKALSYLLNCNKK